MDSMATPASAWEAANQAHLVHALARLKDRLRKRFGYLATELDKGPYLMGEKLSVADAHLWVMIKWTRMVGIDPDQWPSIVEFETRIGSLPSARQAQLEEELVW